MSSYVGLDERAGRKFYVDDPDDLRAGEKLTFLLSLHGGGSVGAWQRAYFPAVDYRNKYRLVIATPSAATKEPTRRWVAEADDAHLRNIVEFVFAKYGETNVKRFWLVGHSQGGMTSRRLLASDPFFQDRVDGWLSLSGGRIGPAKRAPDFSVPLPVGAKLNMPAFPPPPEIACDISHIFAVGEHEIASFPTTSPLAERYGAGPRVRRADVIDTEPGKIHDSLRESYSTKAWGLKPRPGVAQIHIFPNARDGRLIADVVRIDKGHTEGLEPKITEELVRLMVAAPGGKAAKVFVDTCRPPLALAKLDQWVQDRRTMAESAAAYRLNKPLRFDLEGADFKRNPFPTFSAMRAAGPVIPLRLPFVGRGWVTTTYAATIAMVKDNSLFVQEGRHAGKSGVAGMQWWMPNTLRLFANNMLLKDEPDHRRLRKLVDKAFQRRDVQAMRGRIETIADKILDQCGEQDTVDLASDYARRLPLDVICELLGLPHQDRESFAEWTKSFLSLKGPFSIVRAMGSINKMTRYVREQIEECRRAPREGLISELVRAEEDGDKLDESELLSMVLLLLVAGFETTTHLIEDSVVALEENPQQKAFLFADPSHRIERAVEELARFTSPVQSTKPRFVASDCEFFGQSLRRGDIILALVAAANSDPEHFDEPGRLQLDRFPNPHLVFSSGIHFCLGMQLARVEAQTALSRLYARYPNLQIIAPDKLKWIERLGIRGVKTLPVRLNAASVKLAA